MTGWLRRTTTPQRRVLIATFAGYGVDGFDYMVYTFLIPTLLAVWSMTKAEAGYIASATLATSAAGGWVAGVLADRFGRVRILQFTVLWFAIFTFLSGCTRSFGELLFTRALQGFGFGGEWSVGAVLVAETVAARHRGRAAGLVQSSWAVGWAVAALSFWLVSDWWPPQSAWRVLFWLGILPALLVIYIRRRVEESPVYSEQRRTSRRERRRPLFRHFPTAVARTTILASLLCTGMMSAYYSVTTWLPTYLETERQLSVMGTSAYLLVLIAGSFAGYLAGGWACDALGRRRTFVAFAACGIALVLAYTRMQVTDAEMLLLGFPFGFFLSGIFLRHRRVSRGTLPEARFAVRGRGSATTSAAPRARCARHSSALRAPTRVSARRSASRPRRPMGS